MVEARQLNDLNGSQKTNKRSFNEGRRHFKQSKKQKTAPAVAEGSNEDVLIRDVTALLNRHNLRQDDGEIVQEPESQLPAPFSEIEVDIEELSSTGDGLGRIGNTSQVAVVPFVVPGDRVKIKVIRHDRKHPYSVADFVQVTKSSSKRDDDLIRCKYFAKCSGCQFQMMREEDQLEHKRAVVRKAFQYFSNLPASRIPQVGPIHAAEPYGYRTKLTPHFDGPLNGRRNRREGNGPEWDGVPPIGFMLKGTRKTMDIEDCPIATDAVRKGLVRERKRVAKELHKYNRGATLLCRQHTTSIKNEKAGHRLNSDINSRQAHEIKKLLKSDVEALGIDCETEHPEDCVIEDWGSEYLVRTCITDPKQTSTTYLSGLRYDNPAGAFFQNNESALLLFLSHMRSIIRCKPSKPIHPHTGSDAYPNPDNITHLVDAYCGSGLFSIFFADTFDRTIGIDTSSQSIDFATRNAELNNISKGKCTFLAGDAGDIFAHVRDFPADETVVVIDPSRKGCDDSFLGQLLDFAPKRVVYVSCNVHTQARDVGKLCAEVGGKYEIESLGGWDFFPQTAHVEGLCVMTRVDGRKDEVVVVEEGNTEGAATGAAADMNNKAPGSPITGLERNGDESLGTGIKPS